MDAKQEFLERHGPRPPSTSKARSTSDQQAPVPRLGHCLLRASNALLWEIALRNRLGSAQVPTRSEPGRNPVGTRSEPGGNLVGTWSEPGRNLVGAWSEPGHYFICKRSIYYTYIYIYSPTKPGYRALVYILHINYTYIYIYIYIFPTKFRPGSDQVPTRSEPGRNLVGTWSEPGRSLVIISYITIYIYIHEYIYI